MDLNFQNLRIKIQYVNSDQIRLFLLNLNPFILGLWIIINLTIPAYGILLYHWQYPYYHPIFWIFIPDSNSYALLFGIFLLVTLRFKRNIQVLNIITFIGLIKVFFGYIVVFIVQPPFFDLVSLIAHTFEVLEGLLILPFLRTDLRNYSVSSSILIIDWFFDFFNPFGLPTMGLYPKDVLNPNNTAPFLDVFFIVFSVIIFGLLIFIRLKFWEKNEKNVKWIEKIAC